MYTHTHKYNIHNQNIVHFNELLIIKCNSYSNMVITVIHLLSRISTAGYCTISFLFYCNIFQPPITVIYK